MSGKKIMADKKLKSKLMSKSKSKSKLNLKLNLKTHRGSKLTARQISKYQPSRVEELTNREIQHYTVVLHALRKLQRIQEKAHAERMRAISDRNDLLHDLNCTHPELISLFDEWKEKNTGVYNAQFFQDLFDFLLVHHSSEIAVMNEESPLDTNIGEVFIEMIKDDTDLRPLHPFTRQYVQPLEFFIYMVNTY